MDKFIMLYRLLNKLQFVITRYGQIHNAVPVAK